MNLPLFIAKRYLFAKKSHNVINLISAISAIGMAIGTAALIIIMSIYNGFDSLVKSMMSSVEPDLVIEPYQGKSFIPEGEVYDWLYEEDAVKNMCEVVQESVFISYDGRQNTATVKGVDQIYEEETPLRNYLTEGEFGLHRGDVPLASVGASLAYSMGIRPRFLSPIEIYFPSRTSRISMMNPAASVRSINVYPGSLFAVNGEIDNSLIIIPIEKMKEILEYDKEVSSVEIRLTDSRETERIRRGIEERLPKGLCVKDRYQQNESLYKMMKYEKISIYMILIFVIIIIAFNIFGSLSMLIIEKKDDISTLRSLGATEGLIKKIFVFEGWMISLTGLAAGMVIGIILSLIQQHFGIIKMPGSFLVQAYPVILSIKDILITGGAVALIGYLIALGATRRVRT